MTSTEQSLKPSRSITGDTMFQQYIERLTQAQHELGESCHPKLDWMIQWMPTDMK
ncbi:hypothetical protein Godav_011449 [Gossypium davidsonii]|uniref:Uncharacterized protein n=1 Tax=Gossypium davidsonii TaxID=34287 RepID=A0A7J8R9W4_GOSDV|nr:hypothetical protein [Gossypium davidsonii]